MKRFRERTYPFVIEKGGVIGICEACNKIARYAIKYEPDEHAIELSVIALCEEHEKMTRFGKWNVVFKDMDKKIGDVK